MNSIWILWGIHIKRCELNTKAVKLAVGKGKKLEVGGHERDSSNVVANSCEHGELQPLVRVIIRNLHHGVVSALNRAWMLSDFPRFPQSAIMACTNRAGYVH